MEHRARFPAGSTLVSLSPEGERLRNERVGPARAAWEAEDGPFSEPELDAAAAAPRATQRGTS